LLGATIVVEKDPPADVVRLTDPLGPVTVTGLLPVKYPPVTVIV